MLGITVKNVPSAFLFTLRLCGILHPVTNRANLLRVFCSMKIHLVHVSFATPDAVKHTVPLCVYTEDHALLLASRFLLGFAVDREANSFATVIDKLNC
jgi:hypothetical protein